MFKTLTGLLATTLFTATANADINQDYDHYLTGKAPLGNVEIEELYNKFGSEGKSLVDLFLGDENSELYD